MRWLCLSILLLPLAVRAAPGWASKADAADERGHTFVCTGEGKTEADALQSALGICNDKICKVCGVEIESTVTTNETLKGVDLQRKVVERCRRVRKADPVLKSKSLECEEGKCSAWVQLFYSKEDEKAECPAYAREDFADPNACEADVEAFRRQEGRTAQTFRERTRQLNDALARCANIDVRPTPALLAIDEKLRAGLGNFRGNGDYRRKLEDACAEVPGPLVQTFSETRTLTGRIQLLRDFVANKALVFDVIEAAQADDFDTDAGMSRLLNALKAAPLGSQYGAPDVHFVMSYQLESARADARAVAAFFRTSYLPESPVPGMRAHEWQDIATILAADDQTTADEWAWGLRATQAGVCPRCLASLIRARDHGGTPVRLARFFEGLKALRASAAAQVARHPEYGLVELLPTHDPAFVLEVEEHAGEEWRPRFNHDLWKRVVASFQDTQSEADQARALRRLSETAAIAGSEREGEPCPALGRRLEPLLRDKAPPVPALSSAVCECLAGVLLETRRDEKKELLQYALDQHLACVEPR